MESKTSSSLNKKCKSCGGHYLFDPDSQSLVCNDCKSKLKIDKSRVINKHLFSAVKTKDAEYESWIKTQKVFNCKDCGAKIVMNGYDMTVVCPYCFSPYITESSSLPELKPDGIIPFAFGKDQASIKFAQNVKKKFLVPAKFKKAIPASEIKGFYIPAFSCDASSVSTYNGVLSTEHSTTDGNGHTRVYTTRQTISGTYSCSHKDILVESSSQLTQNDINYLLPYNYKDLNTFNNDYLFGYSLEYYNSKISDCKKIANEIMSAYCKEQILKKYTYTHVDSYSQNTKFSNETFSYNVLPVYKFDFKFAKKDYSVLMNGQTSQLGKGLPISKLKIAMLIILAIIVLGGFAVLFLLFGGDAEFETTIPELIKRS